jgi:PPOX class probable F420-dependent enzyme
VTLPDHIRRFLDDTHYLAIATVDPDGGPRQAMIWYRLDGDAVVINSLTGRRWPSNLLRDPRVSLAINDHHGGERWVGITGIAEPILDQAVAQADIAEMARRYNRDDPAEAERLINERFEPQQRISFRIVPMAIHDHLD